jgi:hypothetical protein
MKKVTAVLPMADDDDAIYFESDPRTCTGIIAILIAKISAIDNTGITAILTTKSPPLLTQEFPPFS